MPLCRHCGAEVQQAQNYINRALREGRSLFCDRACAGLARRLPVSKTPEQKKEEKRLYDAQRRIEKAEEIRAAKREHYQRTRDPVKEALIRKARMHLHVAYCQRPEYKAKKAEYDKEYKADEYGPFAEAYRLLLDLERELRSQATSYERRVAKGYYTRNAQKRRRELWQLIRRN